MGRRAILTGQWLLSEAGPSFDEGYVGEIVGEAPHGAVWLATREVAELLIAEQQELLAGSPYPEDLPDLGFDGDVLVLVDVDDTESRYPPDETGRYQIGFGWAWHEADPTEVRLVYGAPELAERFAGPLAVLRRVGVPAYAATLCDCPIVRVTFDDSPPVNLRPRDVAGLLDKLPAHPDALLGRLAMARADAHARCERVATAALQRIETDVAGDRLPQVGSWREVAEYGPGHRYLRDAAVATGVWPYDYVTLYGAVELIDETLAAGSFHPQSSPAGPDTATQRSPTFARPTEIIGGDWDIEDGRVAEAYAGVVVAQWGGGVEWLADRAVAERVVARQERLQAAWADLDPEDVPSLRFDGDTIVLSAGGPDGLYERYAPEPDGRYRISFGWTWAEIDPAGADVVYGGPPPTPAIRVLLAALRAAGIRAVTASAADGPLVRTDLADGGHVEIWETSRDDPAVPRWAAVVHTPSGEPDFELYRSPRNADPLHLADVVEHVATMVQLIADHEAETLHRRVATAVMGLIRFDIASGRVPNVRSFAELHDHVDANEYLIQAAAGAGVATSDLATLNAAAALVDADLADRLYPPLLPPAGSGAEMARRLDRLAGRPPEPPEISL